MKKCFIFAMIIIISFTWIMPTAARKSSDLNKKINEIDSKLEEINNKKLRIVEDKSNVEKDKLELLNDQKLEDTEIEEISKELELINKELLVYETATRESKQVYDQKLAILKSRLRALYENSYSSNFEILTKSENIVNLFERIEVVLSVAKKDKELVNSLKVAKLDAEYKENMLKSIKFEKQGQINNKKEKISYILASRASLEERINESKKELDKLEKLEDDLINQANQLAGHIKDLTKGNTNYAGGTMVWPVPSSKKIDSSFGKRIHPVYKKFKMHTGVDIDADRGAAIVAANNGKVVLAGFKNGYGYTVIIDHGGGITTLYAHCDKLLVRVGDRIKSGNTIAKAGSTGLSTGPHLHFEVRVNGEVTDPMNYIKSH